MNFSQRYLENIRLVLEKIENSQIPFIEKGAEMIADAFQNGHFLYLFGTGHSHMLAEELFYRAGGPVRAYPILEESLMLHNGAHKSTDIERLPGYAEVILHNISLGKGDVIIIISNSGRNAVTVDMGLLAKERGASVIALTNMVHSQSQPSRHPSGLRLYDTADVVLDNKGCIGDASVEIPEMGQKIAPTSTVAGTTILHMMMCEVVEKLMSRNVKPEFYVSSNIDGGDEINNAYFKKYQALIKPL